MSEIDFNRQVRREISDAIESAEERIERLDAFARYESPTSQSKIGATLIQLGIVQIRLLERIWSAVDPNE